MSPGIFLLLFFINAHISISYGLTCSAPVLGIGAILFRPQGMKVEPPQGDDEIVEAGRFFTGAFWTGKVGGGAKTLTASQTNELTGQQIGEFRRRYGRKMTFDTRSRLLLCRDSKKQLMGCLGIAVERIERLGDGSLKAPLMSNVAVGKEFRRLGVGEELVKKAEEIVRKEWGYSECYLYVEKRNIPAVRFYGKLGYRTISEADDYETLLPTESGKIISQSTILLCMRKKLGGWIFSNLFS